MKVEKYIKLINYQIGEGAVYEWKCFGNNARFLDYDSTNDDYYISCIFDTKTQEVYSIDFHDNDTYIAYRWIHPDYVKSYNEECGKHNITDETEYDGYKLIRIEMEEDIEDKIACALLGREYDTRIKLPLDLPDDLTFELMKMAHERDITFNQLLSNVLTESMKKYESTYE